MIKVILDIENMEDTGLETNFNLFNVKTDIKNLEEIRQAINGEISFNETLYDFGGLVYFNDE